MKSSTTYIYILLLFICNSCSKKVISPTPIFPIPSNAQVEWQQMETYAFVHFGLNTFANREWGYGDTTPSIFNPTKLNTDQWAETFKNAGMKGVIITAKHHDGFCLWPTHLTEYCIRNTPYKNGKGDIIEELAASCKKYGLKLGIYVSPWDRNYADYGTPAYIKYFQAQLDEVLSRYGDIFEVWFDGANGGDGYYGGAREMRQINRQSYYQYPKLFKYVIQHQPNTIIFSDGGPGCRWVGNENGFAGATNYSLLRHGEVYPGYPKYRELQYGHADGDVWTAAECDVSIRPGWFYHDSENDKTKSVDHLTNLYYNSVGRNATLLLNFPVNKEGLISSNDSLHAVRLYQRIQNELRHDLLPKARIQASSFLKGYPIKNTLNDNYNSYWCALKSDANPTITYTWHKPITINRIMLKEYIPLGQRIKNFSISYLKDNKWQKLSLKDATTTIGYKRLLRFPNINTKGLRITFENYRDYPIIERIAAFYATETHPSPTESISHNTQLTEMPTSIPFKISRTSPTVLTFDLQQPTIFNHFHYLPNTNQDRLGIATHYRLSAGNTLDKLQIIAKGEFSNIINNPILQHVHFKPIKARYLRFEATQCNSKNLHKGIFSINNDN